jgi:hypothetical protein
VLGAITLALTAFGSAADDGSLETVGGAARLMKERDVRMVSETVRARVSRERVDVDCVFVLRNEGPADTVLIGFPDGPIEPDEHEPNLESFRSWVDGVEVKCERVMDASAGAEVGDWTTASWWTKRVAFAPKAERTIRNHYRVSPAFFPIDGTGGFRYALWTGASWKGPIGSAKVVVTLQGMPLEWVTGTEPEARRDGRTFEWTLRNFEPGSADGSPAHIWLGWRIPERGYPVEPDSLGR